MRTRLAVAELETRLTPAYDLAIDGDAVTANVSVVNTFGVTFLTATGAGAVVDADDIETYLNFGSVVISTGTGGAADGDITWTRTGLADDLSHLAATPRQLTFDNAATGDVTLTGVRMTFNDNVSLNALTGKNVKLADTIVTNARAITLTAADAITTVFDDVVRLTTASGDIRLTAPAIAVNYTTFLTAGHEIDVNGIVNVAAGMGYFARSTNEFGQIRFHDDVTGEGTVEVDGDGVHFDSGVGAGAILNRLNVRNGATAVAGVANVRDLFVGGGNFSFGPPETTWAANVTGNVTVVQNGTLSPGGGEAVGVLNIGGNLTIQGGGALAIDVNNLPDRVTVGGNVTLLSGAQLTSPFGEGTLALGHFPLIDFAGTRAGTFANAPVNVPLTVGRDAVHIAAYGDAGGEITITPAVAAANNVATGTDFDGTRYTVRLTGPGKLVTVPAQGRGSFDVILRGTTTASKVTVTTATADGSDAVVQVHHIGATGALGSFSGGNVNLNGVVYADGSVGALTLRDVFNAQLELGADPARPTTLRVRSMFDSLATAGTSFASITATGALDAIIDAKTIGKLTAGAVYGDVTAEGAIGPVTVTGDYFGELKGLSVGAVKVGGTFSGELGSEADIPSASFGSLFGTLECSGRVKSLTVKQSMSATLAATSVGPVTVGGTVSNKAFGDGWAVPGGVQSLTAGAISGLDVQAGFLGSLSVKGNALLGLRGDVLFSTFELTGNTGTPAGAYGMKTASVAGTVSFSDFIVPNGNVLSFTAARFRGSKLFVGYRGNMPPASVPFFDGNFMGNFKLGSFTVTAKPLGDVGNPLNYAFNGGQVVASILGAVKLSGVQTDTFEASGFRSQFGSGTLRVAAADSPALPLNTTLTASGDPLANDFYFLNA